MAVTERASDAVLEGEAVPEGDAVDEGGGAPKLRLAVGVVDIVGFLEEVALTVGVTARHPNKTQCEQGSTWRRDRASLRQHACNDNAE